VAPHEIWLSELVTVPVPVPLFVTASVNCRLLPAGQLVNLKEAMRVLQLKVPSVFKYWLVYQNVQSSAGSIARLV